MNTRFRHWLVLTLTAFGLIGQASAAGSTDKRDVTIEHYKHFGGLPKAKKIRVINPFGSITTRNTSYDHIELSGIVQKIGDKPGLPQIDVKDNNGVTEVVVSYPRGNKDDEGRLTGRFDLGVWVPGYVDVEMVTDFGDIKVKNHASDIDAKSTSGNVTVSSSGLVSAASVSGNVKVIKRKNAKLSTPAKLFVRDKSKAKTTTAVQSDHRGQKQPRVTGAPAK